jgi:hypothetical protein
MSYKEDLLTAQWFNRRKEILQRDFCRCQHCDNLEVVKNTTKVSNPRIYNHDSHYRIAYSDNKSMESKNLFLKKNQTILNPLYEGNIIPYFYELYKQSVDNVDVLIAMKEEDIDLESILAATNIILKEKGNPPATLDSPNFIYLKKLNEQKRHKRWLLVPGLNVHHNYYIEGMRPWEYNDDALKTLCKHCHELFHLNNQVNIYTKDRRLIKNLTPCSRCDGYGILPQYIHIDNGVCYKCWGSCYEELQ